jgi:hypothetical protein
MYGLNRLRKNLENSQNGELGSTVGSSGGLRLDDLAGFDAPSADANALVAAVNFSFDRTKIHVPATLGHIVRMRDLVTELRTFAADFANLCHEKLQYLSFSQKHAAVLLCVRNDRRRRLRLDHRTGTRTKPANLQYSRTGSQRQPPGTHPIILTPQNTDTIAVT